MGGVEVRVDARLHPCVQDACSSSLEPPWSVTQSGRKGAFSSSRALDLEGLGYCACMFAATGPADRARIWSGDLCWNVWERLSRVATLGPNRARARRFGAFGEGSAVCFPVAALFGEAYIRIGARTIIGPYCSLSAG